MLDINVKRLVSTKSKSFNHNIYFLFLLQNNKKHDFAFLNFAYFPDSLKFTHIKKGYLNKFEIITHTKFYFL